MKTIHFSNFDWHKHAFLPFEASRPSRLRLRSQRGLQRRRSQYASFRRSLDRAAEPMWPSCEQHQSHTPISKLKTFWQTLQD